MMTDMGKENNVKVYWASTTHNRMVGWKFFTKKFENFSQNFHHEKEKKNLGSKIWNWLLWNVWFSVGLKILTENSKIFSKFSPWKNVFLVKKFEFHTQMLCHWKTEISFLRGKSLKVTLVKYLILDPEWWSDIQIKIVITKC